MHYSYIDGGSVTGGSERRYSLRQPVRAYFGIVTAAAAAAAELPRQQQSVATVAVAGCNRLLFITDRLDTSVTVHLAATTVIVKAVLPMQRLACLSVSATLL
jgi:predicted ABC-type sugar transport system permease subunit